MKQGMLINTLNGHNEIISNIILDIDCLFEADKGNKIVSLFYF